MDFVYTVPRERLFPDFYPQGLRPFGDGLSWAEFQAIVAEHGFFVERDHAERTPALKQVIPYAVVFCAGKVLLTRRTRRGGEARLFDKLSIGVGGHVEPIDLSSEPGRPEDARATLALSAARRELHEELFLEGLAEIHPVGILNDDSNPVGAVHLGLVLSVQVEGDVRVRERDLLEGELVAPDELRALLEEGADFETWSELLVRSLDELLPHPLVSLH